jgi:hypothetical protein
MAIWQFSLYLIPNGSIKERFEQPPSKLSMEVAEDTPWWSGHQPQRDFEDAISAILPEAHSWSKSMRIWGVERSDSILVSYRTEERIEVEEIEVRIDASNLSGEFVLHVCKWIEMLDCLCRTKAYDVVLPDVAGVQAAIANSRAMKFIENPVKTLQGLKNEEFEGTV